MNPNLREKDDCNIRNSTNIPSHGYIPKWLEDITETVSKEQNEETLMSHIIGDSQKINISNITDQKISKMENKLDKTKSTGSAKFGRRSSLGSEIMSKNKPRNIELNDEYLVPKLDENFDFSVTDFRQSDLEKSWKSLNDFNQSHKGRLNTGSANKLSDPNLDEYTSKSNSNEIICSYSPSVLDEVPNRCRSELSEYLPMYAYNIYENVEELKICKSKSSESICKKFECDIVFNTSFKKHLDNYKKKIAEEEQMRENIIQELLSENEKITSGRRRHSLACTSEQKLYQNNSKYKSKLLDRKDLFGNENCFSENFLDIFVIPKLPKGGIMIVDILSTWGDKYYVGLNGIEIFDDEGHIANVKNIYASPADVNILPECNNDPRVITNLLDGVNRTQDDLHIWLAPFNFGSRHLITIEFVKITTIAMIRIWNYNKSRIHSYRGVRDIVIYLDNSPIFKGEIAKACGGILGGIHHFGDTILFTTDEYILDKISKNDTSYRYLTSEPNTPQNKDNRPPTSLLKSENRPITGTLNINENSIAESVDQVLLGASQMDLVLLQNWGHKNVIGLTGFEVVEGADNILKLSPIHLSCSLENRCLHRLINQENLTTKPKNMWLVPFDKDKITISVNFNGLKYISGINIWNYNENLQLSYSGVQTMRIFLDGKPVINSVNKSDIFILRRAPGNNHYDFVQEIKFLEPEPSVSIPPVMLNCNPYSVIGFVLQIVIYSTWGDKYYCGLNGLEIYNEQNEIIPLQEQNICAYPESVNTLPNVSGDVRTPDKLIDGINDDESGVHSWLSPIIPKNLNRIYIVMDVPIAVSYVKFWNYSKTSYRCVKDFGILMDDLLICTGSLMKYDKAKKVTYEIVRLLESELSSEENLSTQDIILLDNESNSSSDTSLTADQTLRPFTCISPYNRGSVSKSN